MILQLDTFTDVADVLYSFLNEKGIFLIDTECSRATIDSFYDAGISDKAFININYKQIDNIEFADIIREFFDNYTSKTPVITDTQRGRDPEKSYGVVYDEGGYFSCTCSFYKKTNRVCHHIVALYIRVINNTTHIKVTTIIKRNRMEVVYDVGKDKLFIPESIEMSPIVNTEYNVWDILYDLLKYGLSIGEIKELYNINMTGYNIIANLGAIKNNIKIRKMSVR